MGKRRVRPGELLGVPKNLVNLLKLPELFPAIAKVLRRIGVKEIQVAHRDQKGFGRDRIEEVPTVEA